MGKDTRIVITIAFSNHLLSAYSVQDTEAKLHAVSSVLRTDREGHDCPPPGANSTECFSVGVSSMNSIKF